MVLPSRILAVRVETAPPEFTLSSHVRSRIRASEIVEGCLVLLGIGHKDREHCSTLI